MTGVAESTRPCSWALAMVATAAMAEKMTIFFMEKLLSGRYITHQTHEKFRRAKSIRGRAAVNLRKDLCNFSAFEGFLHALGAEAAHASHWSGT
jgi:hypothetical protein